jgi:hypothetical protein
MAIIIIMMSLLAVLPSVIFKDGKIDSVERRLNNMITLFMFAFFIITNILLSWTALGMS